MPDLLNDAAGAALAQPGLAPRPSDDASPEPAPPEGEADGGAPRAPGISQAPPAGTSAGTESAFAPDAPPRMPARDAVQNDEAPSAAQAAASNTLISDTELETALAEIELLCAGTRDAPAAEETPELPATAPEYDGPDATAPKTPETDAGDRVASTKSEEPPPVDTTEAPAEPEPAEVASAAASAPPVKKVRFKIGKVEPETEAATRTAEPPTPAPPEVDAPASAEAPAETDAPATVSVAPPTVGKRLYRVADGVLELMNRPFAAMPSRLRDLIGGVAVSTLCLSLVMPLVLGMFASRRDAVSFLRERRLAFENPPAPADSGAHGDSAGGHGKTEAHGKKADAHAKKADAHGKKADGHGKKADAHAKKPDSKKGSGHGKKADAKKKESGGHH